MRPAFVLPALLAGLAGLATAGDGEKPGRFTITARRPDDRVEVLAGKDGTVFDVKSPFGISGAVLRREDDHWPGVVVLRLHLRGLEDFRASAGKVTLHAAAGLRDGKPEVRQWRGGKEEAPVDEKSPFRMDIRIRDAAGKPAKALPPEGGYFEVVLPGAFFEGNPRSITLGWIDFYRG